MLGSFFTGAAGGAGRDPLHRAVHGGGHRRRAVPRRRWRRIAVFLAMGLGLAAPYVVLATAARAWRACCRGPAAGWSVLRQALAFPMYGAAAWLLWVLSQQAGPDGVLAIAAGLVLLGFAGWALGPGAARRRQRPSRRRDRRRRRAAGTSLRRARRGVAATAASRRRRAADGRDRSAPPGSPALRAEGRPVFVDMTAAWCVTCLVNERVALRPTRCAQAFAAARRGLSEGRLDPPGPGDHRFPARATAATACRSMCSIPPAAAPPVVLPQILTPGIVLDALARLPSHATG